MGKTKKFINKKTAVTFKLVHRSQKDPLIADETAPQNVLMQLGGHASGSKKKTNSSGKNKLDVEKRKQEQAKFGIYFDDDYDYLQHLRDVNLTSEWEEVLRSKKDKESSNNEKSASLQLPSSVFASTVEEDEGMLNKAVLPIGPQPDWDPDVVAAMEEDFDFDDPNNLIDDDFIKQAGGCGDGSERIDHDHDGREEDEDEDNWEDCEDEADLSSNFSDNDEDDEEHDRAFMKEETRSHFTNYSMTSSVIRRNDGLRLLDERFETLYEKEYADDCDIGALDLEDISGCVSADPDNSLLLAQLIQDFEKNKNLDKEELEFNRNDKEFIMKSIERRIKRGGDNDESDEKDEMNDVEIYDTSKRRADDRLDCESILSTYSTLYNHPKLIREEKRIRINPKTGIPYGVLDKPGLTARKLAQLDALNKVNSDDTNTITPSVRSRQSRLSTLSVRPNNETPQDRRARKIALKEYRKERRVEKKINKLAFISEKIRQDKEVTNLQNHLRGVKLV